MKTVTDKFLEFWDNPVYDYCYIAIDLHGTIFRPSRNGVETFQYYPMAKQCLKELSKNPKVKLIIWSSSYIEDICGYLNKFVESGINIDYINENPECKNSSYANFDYKFYFDIGIDDKFGFDALVDWQELYPEILTVNLNNIIYDSRTREGA